MAVGLLSSTIRQDIYNVYGFVRIADEIVDTFEGYPQEELLTQFEKDLWYALEHEISANPVINAFQKTVKEYDIPHALIRAFLKSMRADLTKKVYVNQPEIEEYINGSADVVGLMCLKIFVKGDEHEYERLKNFAVKLGSAFQKINFLRDLKHDYEELSRTYFPQLDFANFKESDKDEIVADIANDFQMAKKGVVQLPEEARFGVYVAYTYFYQLLEKIDRTPAKNLVESRIRVSNRKKLFLLVQAFLKHKLRLV